MAKSNRRALTLEEQSWADNLRAIWAAKHKGLGLTQLRAAQELGYKTQSAFSQFLNGIIPLHTDAKAVMAHLLQVHATDIDPDFFHRLHLAGAVLAISLSSTETPAEAVDSAVLQRLIRRLRAIDHAAPLAEELADELIAQAQGHLLKSTQTSFPTDKLQKISQAYEQLDREFRQVLAQAQTPGRIAKRASLKTKT